MHPIRAGGAVLNDQSHTGVVWSLKEVAQHINYLELPVAFLAIRAFGKTWQNTTVLLRLDNATAVSYVHKPERGQSVESFVPTSNNDLDLVHIAKQYFPSKAPFWPTELSS